MQKQIANVVNKMIRMMHTKTETITAAISAVEIIFVNFGSITARIKVYNNHVYWRKMKCVLL